MVAHEHGCDLAALPHASIVDLAARRTPVTVNGAPARLIGAPKRKGARVRVEFADGVRRTVPISSLEGAESMAAT